MEKNIMKRTLYLFYRTNIIYFRHNPEVFTYDQLLLELCNIHNTYFRHEMKHYVEKHLSGYEPMIVKVDNVQHVEKIVDHFVYNYSTNDSVSYKFDGRTVEDHSTQHDNLYDKIYEDILKLQAYQKLHNPKWNYLVQTNSLGTPYKPDKTTVIEHDYRTVEHKVAPRAKSHSVQGYQSCSNRIKQYTFVHNNYMKKLAQNEYDVPMTHPNRVTSKNCTMNDWWDDGMRSRHSTNWKHNKKRVRQWQR